MRFLCIFSCVLILHFAVLIMAPEEMQQSPVPGHLQHLHGKHLPHWGLNAHLGSQVWPLNKYLTFSNFFANSTSFQKNLEALPPLPSSSARTCSKLTVPLILPLCFLSEIDNEDVTQIQEGWWDTGLAPNLSQLMKMVIKRSTSDSPENQGAHTGEWGELGGKWLPWNCLYNWGHLSQSLAGVSSSPHCLGAFPLSSSQSLPWHTDSNDSNT